MPMPSNAAYAGRASLAMSGWVDRLMTMAAEASKHPRRDLASFLSVAQGRHGERTGRERGGIERADLQGSGVVARARAMSLSKSSQVMAP